LKRIRKEIQGFSPYSPGLSVDEIKDRYNLDRVVKLASNENPLGAAPLVQKTIQRTAPWAFRYPRAGNPRICRALAEKLGVPEKCVVAGNGSDEILDLLIRITCTPGRDKIAVFDPAFSMYRLLAGLCGVECVVTPLNPDFSFPWQAVLDKVDESFSLVFVTSPDNPTGYAAPAGEIVRFARDLPDGCLLVVDEAYIEFTDDPDYYSPLARFGDLGNLVVTRTFSKLFGLAGLRLGYGIMPEWLADYVLRVKPPFSVNIMAEEAGLAALRDEYFIKASLDCVAKGKQMLARELVRLGCETYPSQANFLLFKPPMPAEAVFQGLLEKGIIVRPLKSYGLADHLRVSIGDERENREFAAALEQVIGAGASKA